MAEAPFAVLGLYPTAQALTDAVPKVKSAGFDGLEAYTPYPIHRLDEVLGLKKTPLGFLVLGMGLVGTASALGLEWFADAVDYPFIVGGKALFSWQAFVPVMFEVTVLFATFTAGLAMLFVLNKLPFFGHPVLASKSIAAITCDRFALSIERGEGGEKPIDVAAARRALEATGAESVEVVGDPAAADTTGAYAPFTPRDAVKAALMIAVACAVAGAGMYAAVKVVLTVPPITHIQNQPKLNAQRASTFFADGSGMRLPVAGTVARGHLPYPFKSPEEAEAALANPLPRTAAVLEKGRREYADHCGVCHGSIGNGEPSLSSAYGGKPANLVSATFRGYSDARLYHVITVGKNAMPSYAADLAEDERWAVVHYLRALQRSQNARDEDVR